MRIEVKYRIEKCDESKCIISVLGAVTICGFDWFSPGIVGGFWWVLVGFNSSLSLRPLELLGLFAANSLPTTLHSGLATRTERTKKKKKKKKGTEKRKIKRL